MAYKGILKSINQKKKECYLSEIYLNQKSPSQRNLPLRI